MSSSSNTLKDALVAIAIDDQGRVCKDIPESACQDQPKNFLTHVGSLSLSKLSDGLIDPKLVLSWLMTHLGTPVGLIGLLVPIREAGALLPQMFTAARIRSMPRRKWAWAFGAGLQGAAAIAIALIALSLTGKTAGWLILGALAVLALARSVCSVSYKDVLGKTVSKSRRGTATGLAGTLSASGILLFAAALAFAPIDRFVIVTIGLFLAGVLWISGALLFTNLSEDKGATEGGRNGIAEIFESLSHLGRDNQLTCFIVTRALLTATALAPPFMISLAGEEGQAYEGLGYLVFASAFASLISSYVWGRLADRSSRKVLILSALLGGLALSAAVLLSLTGHLGSHFVLPAALFILMIGYQGVRLGRSTHLVDMATQETRAIYTALSNTIIGVILILGSGFSLIAEAFGPETVLSIMAIMCGLAILTAWRLNEVQMSED